ncbi:MAG: TolC family protein [Sphaerochaetaceae bacterium]|nr:TolC family protein [Sphaerochaetaceae bacterium]
MKRFLIFLLLTLLVFPAFAVTQSDLHEALLSNNPDIKKARAEVSKALLDVKDAKAGYTPTIDFTVTGSYIANPIDPIRINLGDYVNSGLLGTNNDYITVFGGQESMYYQFSLQLTQPIFTWGKLSMAVQIYQAIYEARVLQLEDVIEQAETELSTRVAALHFLLQIQSLLQDQLQITARLVQLADDAYANGMMLATDALGVKVQARQLDVAKSQIDQQVLLMMTNIRNLTGLADLESTDIVFDESSFEANLDGLLASDYAALVSKCLSDARTNFQLLSKMSEIAKLSNGIAGASVNWKPDFALVVNADYSGSRLPLVETDWYGKDDWSATITVAMKTTLYDGGKAVRNVNRTADDVNSAQVDIQSAKAKIRATVDENWTNMAVCMAQMEYQTALEAQLDSQLEVKKKLLDTGYGSESDYLQVQLERNNCEIQILQTRISLATALNTLLYLEGDAHRQ